MIYNSTSQRKSLSLFNLSLISDLIKQRERGMEKRYDSYVAFFINAQSTVQLPVKSLSYTGEFALWL